MRAQYFRRLNQPVRYAAPVQTHPDVNTALALWLRAQLANTGLASAHHSQLPISGAHTDAGMKLHSLFEHIQQGHAGDYMPYADLAQDTGLFENHGQLIRDLDRLNRLTQQYHERSQLGPTSAFVTQYATPGRDAVGDPAAERIINRNTGPMTAPLPMTARLLRMLQPNHPAVHASMDNMGAEATTGHLGRLLALHNAMLKVRHGGVGLAGPAQDALSEIGSPIFANLNTRERFYPTGRRDLGI